MSLINCPECSKEVSDKAEECPNCGYPIKNMIPEKNEEEKILNTLIESNKPLSISELSCYEELKEYSNQRISRVLLELRQDGKVIKSKKDDGTYVFVATQYYKTQIDNETKQKDLKEYQKISLEKNERSAKKIAMKLYYVLILNNMPCSIFPKVEEWSLVNVWIEENIENLKKITLDEVKKVSKDDNIASLDYEEYKKFIEHYNKLYELKKKSKAKLETESKKREKNIIKDLEEEKRKFNSILQPTQVSESMPKCPNCGSINIESISNLSRVTSIGLWGLASSKIGKTKQCNSCGYKW